MNSTRTLLFPALLLGAAGCIPPTGVPAPSSAGIVVPEEVSLSWAEDYNESGDQEGALYIMDISVYDEITFEQLPYIEVELITSWYGVYLIPQTAVKYVALPDYPGDEVCDVDGDGAIDPGAPDDCSWYWDTSGNEYFELSQDFADVYRPTYMVASTDERGILRAYVYIDHIPYSESSGNWQDVYVTASLGHTSAATVFTVAE